MIDLLEVCYRADLAETGIWCPAHRLPCLVRVPIHQVAITADGVTDLGPIGEAIFCVEDWC